MLKKCSGLSELGASHHLSRVGHNFAAGGLRKTRAGVERNRSGARGQRCRDSKSKECLCQHFVDLEVSILEGAKKTAWRSYRVRELAAVPYGPATSGPAHGVDAECGNAGGIVASCRRLMSPE
jgi:hypothetical protein